MDQHAFAQLMRQKREKAGISLRAMAIYMDVSAAYLSDMELGNRRFTNEHRDAFNDAIRTQKAAK